MDKKPPSERPDLTAAREVMKRMLQTPPTPHEAKGDGKPKAQRKAPRKK